MFKLCYVEDGLCWFTTAPLEEQWGDDWNDAPYEHNAGPPYPWAPNRETEPYELAVGRYTGPLLTPAERYYGPNTPYSVETLNKCVMPWLSGDYADSIYPVLIYAGATPLEVAVKIKKGGGQLWVGLDDPAKDWIRKVEG